MATKEKATKSKSVKKSVKKSEKLNLCLCGCGTRVKGKFVQGHDAKLHSIVVEHANAGTKLPAALRKLAGEYIRKRWKTEARQVL